MEPLLTKDRVEVVLVREEDSNNGIEISLRDIMEVIIKGKWLIAVITAVCLLVSVIGVNFSTPLKGKASVIISFNFDGIEKGLDPYGKTFDVSKVKSPVVLDKVVDALELNRENLSTDIIRSNLHIVPVIPGDITEKIKQLEEARKQNIKDLQDFTYYPNRYMIIFDVSKSMALSGTEAQEILNEVVKQYQEYFYYSYSDRDVLSNALGSIDYSEYDYPEVSTVIHNHVDVINSYLAAKTKENEGAEFRSKKTGLAFSDIMESIEIIDKVDLNRLDSIIESFNLTKDKEKLIKLYDYRIRMAELNKAKKEDESKLLNDTLTKYQREKNVVLMPDLTENNKDGGVLEVQSSDSYYDELADKTVSAGVAARNNLHDSQYYRQRIDRLMQDTTPVELKKSAEKDVLALIPKIKEKLENWIKLTNETVAEYYEFQLYNRAIKTLSPAEYRGGIPNSSLYMAIALVLGLMIGLFTVFFREYWRRSGKTIAES